MNYQILRYSEDFEDHVDQIARLKTINWGLDFDVFRSYVKWNYLDRPQPKPPIIYFVRAGEKIVAMRGAYESVWQVKSAGIRFDASISADLLILEEYRNKGIYKELIDFVLEDLRRMGVQYYLSFNATPLSTVIALAHGHKGIGEIGIMKKHFRTDSSRAVDLAKSLAGRRVINLIKRTGIHSMFRKRAAGNSERYDNIYQQHGTQLPRHITLEDKPRPQEMARLTDSTLPEDKITLVRDESYFRWRYNNPLSKYLFIYWHDSEMKGYLVLQSHIYGVESIGSYNVFELEATDPAVRMDLLSALISIVNDGSISVWTNLLDRDSCEFIVSKGFQPVQHARNVKEYKLTMLIHPIGIRDDELTIQGVDLLDKDNWDFKMTYMHDH